MSRISVPTTARLPSSLRVDPANPAVTKILGRLSRASLLSVALDWLHEDNLPLAAPYLRRRYGDEDGDDGDDDDDDDTDDFYPPARSPEALRALYADLQARKGSKREVLDRILEGDWRHGLTLYQLAMADLQYLYDHPTSQKWSAYRIVPLKPPTDPDGEAPPEVDKESLTIPRFHPSTFLRTLQTQVLPDVKAHYTFDAHKTLPLLLLRIFVLDSPYNTNLSLQSTAATATATTFDASRTIYIAFPHASPHLFLSRPQTTTKTNTTATAATATATAAAAPAAGETFPLHALLVDGLPRALSRPRQRQRVTLRATGLATRNLAELCARRGGGRGGSAAGGWAVYHRPGGDDEQDEGRSPLDLSLPSLSLAGGSAGRKRAVGREVAGEKEEEEEEERAAKRARLVAKARFGDTARMGDGLGVERVDVVVEDAFPDVVGEEGEGGGEGEREGRDEDDGVSGATGGRSARGGRRSQVHAVLDKAADEADDDDDDDDGQRQEEPVRGWRPHVRLTFHGSHVFAGIRQLVECGIIDGEKMPGWMTGEEGVTIGAVRHGRIRGHKGSGV